MKKLLLLTLSSLMIFSLTACGNSNAENLSSSPKQTAAATVTDKDTAASAKTTEDKTANSRQKLLRELSYRSIRNNPKLTKRKKLKIWKNVC